MRHNRIGNKSYDPCRNISERWYRHMYRKENITVNGQEFELQSVSPRWYFEVNQRCGMSGDNKDILRYMDTLFKNVVTCPIEVIPKGFDYFEEREDIETAELLVREIERFLRPGKQHSANAGAAAGAAE